MWALLSAVIFFAVAWLLGKLFRIESLHRISEIAIYVSAALFVITNPVGMIRWPAKAIKWLCHAGLLLPLPERFHRMAAWSLFAVEALSAFIYLLGMWLGIRPLQSGATIAFSAGLLLVAIILFPLLFRSVCWLLYWCGKIICGSLFFGPDLLSLAELSPNCPPLARFLCIDTTVLRGRRLARLAGMAELQT